MKKAFLTLLIIGLCLLFVGGGVFVVALGAAGWNVKAFSSVQVDNLTFTENAETPLSTIKIDYENADLSVALGEAGGVATVSYPQPKDRRGNYTSDITLTEENGVLTIVEKSNPRGWLSLWNFATPKLVVTIPQDRVFALALDTDNGDITLGTGEYSFHSLRLESDNGDIRTAEATMTVGETIYMETNNGDIALGAFTATGVSLSTDNGDIRLLGGEASGKIELDADNGDIEFDGRVRANELSAETDNGDVDGSDGVLSAEKISLSSDVGDIEAKLAGAQTDYTITVERDLGESNVVSGGNGGKRLSVSTDVGDIEIVFVG